ncbi:hypothetical protein [Frigoriglobus tundricola]|uniref:hypothetical protein n=1 Tax=Frigoriglobus tundricola TaxID=2774151 RepID=UPI00148EAC78|nr:hypothetical protein [Frigoriglobus tundricola]
MTELTQGVLSVVLANKLKTIGNMIAAAALAVGAGMWMTTTAARPTISAAQQTAPSAEHRDAARPRAERELSAARANEDEFVPPSDAEVLRAMPRAPRAGPSVYEAFRDNITIVKTRLGPRVVRLPLFAGASVKLTTELWECTVHYERAIELLFPFPIRVRFPQMERVEIHKLKSGK